MIGNDDLTRAEVNAQVRDLAGGETPDHSLASAASAGFPIFSEWHQWEFDRSPWPMRIFEHGTFRFLAVNDATVKLYGYTRKEFLAMTAMDTRHPEERADLLTALDEPTGYFRHRGPRRHVKKNGEVIVVEAVTQDVLYNGRKARLSMNIDVTEHNRLVELLRQREQEFESLAEHLPDLVARFDRHHRLVDLNSAVEKLLGVRRQDLFGKTQRELGLPDALVGKFEHSLDQSVRKEKSHSLEFSIVTPEGERLFEAYHVPERDAAGRFVSMLCVARDITERKRAEDALRDSNEFLRSMIESSCDCIKVLDLEGRLESMNQGGQQLLGIEDIKPLLGASWLEFWSSADREAATRALDAARNGGTGSFEGYCPTVRGEPRWWDVVISSILDAGGKAERLLAVSRDITERRRTQDALHESEERFRLLAENIRQVFWINTPAGDHIDYISPGYEEIWGRSRESLYRNPHSWMESIHSDDLPAVRAGQEAIARGKRTDVDYRIIRPDGTLRWIKDRSYPMRRGDGTRLVCGLAEDISVQKRAEQERIAQAIHQRDALVREVHHRIKNSLQGVVGLLRQKIRRHPVIAPEIEEAVAQLQSVALVYGLQQTRPDGLIALAEIMDEVCASAEGLTGGHVERTRERRTTRPACVAGSEAVSVAVALNELVFNALKHQAGAGKKRARVTLLESKDGAEIRVTNRGHLPKGFDYAGGRMVGHGLGLVRTLLAAPGGSVAFNGGRNEVEVVLKLRPPLLAERQKAFAG